MAEPVTPKADRVLDLAGGRVHVFVDADAAVAAAAAGVVERLRAALPSARLVLAGGNTPRALYARMAGEYADALPWRSCRYAFGDERMVPPDAADSNFGMVRRTLFDPLGIPYEPLAVPTDTVLRTPGERGGASAADVTHRELRDWAQRVPLFDVVLLGLGEDAHTASLFPGSPVPDTARLALAVRHPDGSERVTLTPAALRSTRHTCFLVLGAGKAGALAATVNATEPADDLPAVGAFDPGNTAWFVDAAAAARLAAGGPE